MAPIEYPEELSRGDFLNLVQQNQSIMVIKFGAEWCKPCQRIKSQLNDLCSKLPTDITCLDIDVDENFDLYAYMKTKKMIRTIPSIMCFTKEEESFVPHFSISSSDPSDVLAFFNQVVQEYKNTKIQ